MAGCINRRILHVDLTQGTTWVEEPDESFYRKYGGGSAMGMYYILKETPRGIDAFDPRNVLTLFGGVPTGLPISGQARVSANAKSPMGGAIGDAQAGGFWPAELKFSGFDGIVIKGKANKPVYLWLHEGEAEIRDASHLWGKLTGDSEDAIRQELGDDKIEVLQIGPAGENLVRFACLINMSNRANGRTGMGAVMGSKNLKAVAVRGTKRMVPAEPEVLQRLGRQGVQAVKNRADIGGLSRNGTADGVPGQQASGTLPTFNFNEGQFEHYERISGETMTNTILKEQDTCYACAIRCKRVVETEFQGHKVLPKYGGPEYETVATLGSYCGVSDLSAIALANQLCNAYGMDTISCGATIAWAMEGFQRGQFTAQETGGVELKFGDAAAVVRMVEMIGKRQGFGDVLAEGSQRAAQRLGKGTDDNLITVKGTEAPAHMPQAKHSLSLIYAVNPFGADHQSHEHDPVYEPEAGEFYLNKMAELGLNNPQPSMVMNDEKVKMTYVTQLFFSGLDSYCFCQFVWGPSFELYSPKETVELLKAATGWDVTLDEFQLVGERRLNMMRAFNAREGMDARQDTLPPKFLRPLQGTGPTAGVYFKAEEAEHYRQVYYRMAGWDVSTGNPSREKLASLDLDWIDL